MRFVVAGDDFEAEVFDHLKIEFRRLAFRRQAGCARSTFVFDCCAR